MGVIGWRFQYPIGLDCFLFAIHALAECKRKSIFAWTYSGA